ncbi:hypothetical protein ACHAXR_008621 [Thalassiosira sp. AJA248-18]
MVAPALRLLSILIASWFVAQVVDSSIPRSSSGTASHPSSQSRLGDFYSSRRPAWNASPKINNQGYLCEELYRRIPGEWEAECPHTSIPNESQDLNAPVIIRQVPGDGDCLFHAVAISLNLIQGGRHLSLDDAERLWELKHMSRRLRRIAVECLRSCNDSKPPRRRFFHRQKDFHDHPRKRKAKKYSSRLFIQGCESMATSQLLSTAAAQYGISSEEYCDLMEQDSYWGGGPEIVALCNVLKRPIHVYELVAAANDSMGNDGGMQRDTYNKIRVPNNLVNKQFRLRRMATFGSPKYDSKKTLHILSADSRFPDVQPEIIRENGNHFMAIFPVDILRRWVNTTCENGHERFDPDRKRRVRGGATNAIENSASCGRSLMLEEEVEETCVFHGEWFNDFNYNAPLEGANEWELDRSSLRVSNCWHRKLFRLSRKEHLNRRKQTTESPPGNP